MYILIAKEMAGEIYVLWHYLTAKLFWACGLCF